MLLMIVGAAVLSSGCIGPNIRLFADHTFPLREFVLEGRERGKVLVISVRGVISDAPRRGMMRPKPSMVQEIVSQLRRAEKDREIKAVILKIDSPGGTTTASDVLYKEIMDFKKKTGAKVVTSMMGVAASGGYYIALPSDKIMAHPTTITGSLGVIFLRPKVTGLMDKIGVKVEINKSGENKDMGSPFRRPTSDESEIFQGLTEEFAGRFRNLLLTHRKLEKKTLDKVSTARVYHAKEALELGLIDEIGYLSDALSRAKEIAGLSKDAKVVVYRRTTYPDDNIYNSSTNRFEGAGNPIIDLGILNPLTSLSTGFYYMWLPAVDGE
ncbi:MAG: signal peptide peptidase SppA [Proteobacteria bacterium]|nr:signal peptide peptidase SppA [Pseudomonadota bacterium]